MSKSKLKRNLVFSIIMAVLSIAIIIADFIFINTFFVMPLFSMYCVLPFFGIVMVLFVAKAINGILALNKGETYDSIHKVLSKVTTALLILVLVLNFGFSNYYLMNFGMKYANLSSEQNAPKLYEIFNVSPFTNVVENVEKEHDTFNYFDYSKFLKSESIYVNKNFSAVDCNGEETAPIQVKIEYSKDVLPIFNFIRYEMLKMSLSDKKYDENKQYVYSYILGDYDDSVVAWSTTFSLLSKENGSFLYVYIETWDPDFRIDEEKALEYFKTAGEEALRTVNPT